MINLIVREENVNERVRVSKTLKYLIDNGFKPNLIKKKSQLIPEYNVPTYEIIKNNNSKVWENIKWMFALLIHIIGNKDLYTNNRNIAIGFETSVVFYFISFFIRIEYIYDNPDNFFQSHNFPKWVKNILRNLENDIINKSNYTIFPDSIRAAGFNIKDKSKVKILFNYPSINDILYAFEYTKNLFLDIEHKYVYVNGWLTETRGKRTLKGLLSRITDNDKITIIIAGKLDDKDIIENINVIYLGLIPPNISLAYYLKCDYLLSLYDPKIEINKYACPNKWGDAIILECTVITNHGILTSDKYFGDIEYYKIEYNNSVELYKLLKTLPKKRNNPVINVDFKNEKIWENQLHKIFK